MKTLALLLLAAFSLPAHADDSCNEETVAKIRGGSLGHALAVNVRHMALLDMSLELNRHAEELGGGHILRPMHNLELAGGYKEILRMRVYLKAQRDQLEPCLAAMKEMRK